MVAEAAAAHPVDRPTEGNALHCIASHRMTPGLDCRIDIISVKSGI
jgi:hypothetical protein